MTIFNLTHFDLDGVVSHICVKHLLGDKPVKLKCGGYGKVQKMISELQPEDFAIITDLSLDVENFHFLKSRIKDNYLWIDHHESSFDAMNMAEERRKVFDLEWSASMLTFRRMVSKVSLDRNTLKGMEILVKASDAYDLWRVDTPAFKVGYNLNTLFWEYNFWNFAEKFKNGFLGFDDQDKEVIHKAILTREQAFEDSPTEFVNYSNIRSLVIAPTDRSIINDVGLRYGKEVDLCFIVCKYPDNISVSVRMGSLSPECELYNLSEVMSELSAHPQIIDAGGHKNSAGITCLPDTDMETIDIFVQAISEELFVKHNVPF